MLAVCAAAACDSNDPGPPTPGPTTNTPDLGTTDGSTPTPTPEPDPGAQACAMISTVGTLANKPVDIIFVIDNSGSMTNEIQAVEAKLHDVLHGAEVDQCMTSRFIREARCR